MNEQQTFPEEMRKFEGARDITSAVIESMYRLNIASEIRLLWEDIYADFWREKGINPANIPIQPAIAVNPEDIGTTGRSAKYRNPVDAHSTPVPLSTPANTTLFAKIESRGTVQKINNPLLQKAKYNVLHTKGTGISMLINPGDKRAIDTQFNRRPVMKSIERSWDSLGGLLLKFARTDFSSALIFTAIHKELYGEHADVRMPLAVVDITTALKQEGAPKDIEPHCQVQYPVKTTVRSNYNHYLTTLTELWLDLDLKNPAQKKQAINRLNAMFLAHPSGYNKNTKPLTEQEVLSVVRNGKNIFTLIEAYTQAMAGGESDEYSRTEIELQVTLKHQMAQVGHELARLFYKKNTETIQKMIVAEATKLGRNVGIALALGIEDYGFSHPKDTYGGMISDLDNCGFYFTDGHIDLTNMKQEDMLNNGRGSIFCFSEIHGVPSENIKPALVAYLKAIVITVKRTIQRLDQLPLSQEYQQQIKNLYASRINDATLNNQTTMEDYLRKFIFNACSMYDGKFWLQFTIEDRTMPSYFNQSRYKIPATNIITQEPPIAIQITTQDLLN